MGVTELTPVRHIAVSSELFQPSQLVGRRRRLRLRCSSHNCTNLLDLVLFLYLCAHWDLILGLLIVFSLGAKMFMLQILLYTLKYGWVLDLSATLNIKGSANSHPKLFCQDHATHSLSLYFVRHLKCSPLRVTAVNDVMKLCYILEITTCLTNLP